jgi:hypothetical protein
MNKQKLEEQRIASAKAKKRKLQLTLFPVTAVVIVFVLIVGGVLPIGNPFQSGPTPSFSPPQVLPWGSFAQVSNANFGSHVNIYYISWYGCPYGAADSWVLYNTMNHYGNASLASPNTHHSSATDIYKNTPGLLFYQKYYNANFTFDPIYLYNQTMTGTPLNTPINGSLLLYGLNETSLHLPSNVQAIEKNVMTKYDTKGFSLPTGIANGHVNTNIIITGPHGAWVLNGALFSPSKLGSYSPSYLEKSSMNLTYVYTAVISTEQVIGEA